MNQNVKIGVRESKSISQAFDDAVAATSATFLLLFLSNSTIGKVDQEYNSISNKT